MSFNNLNRREAIINAAKKLFTEHGFKRVSMDEIAFYAGVAKGTIYLYFKSKNDLFKYLVLEHINNMKKIVEDSKKSSSSFFDGLHKSLYEMLKYRKNSRFINAMIAETEIFGNPSILEYINIMNKSVISYIENKLDKAISEGEVKECNRKVMAFLIFEIYMGIAFDWEKMNGKMDEQEISQSISLLFKKGIEA